MKLIFFGAGYCSKYILPSLDKKYEIICTHNLNIKAEKFDSELNIKRLTYSNFLKKKNLYFRGVTHIINSIPPVNNSDLVYNLIGTMSDGLIKKLKWFGYLSSTSVYGDHSGSWVNESAKMKAETNRGRNRINVENLFLKKFQKNKLPIHIFRLPGIYGPGRSSLDKLIKGDRSIIKKKNHYFSRIHVEDIASAIILSMKKITPGQIFNITDDYPCSADKVKEYAAKLLKINDLEYINLSSSSISDKAKDFYKDNKRVSNSKIKKILGWTPKFENYKLGLENIIKRNF